MKGFVGEIFSSIQGEGIYAGCRQVFVRLAGCPLRCVYCDAVQFGSISPHCMVEHVPGSGRVKRLKNPIDAQRVLKEVRRLWTSDAHSVSLTGGEPLSSSDFLVELARGCKKSGWGVYLETSGNDSEAMESVAPYVEYTAIDLKLPEHRATKKTKWADLLKEELNCVRTARRAGIKTFVKIVILKNTKKSQLTDVCRKLRTEAKVPIVLQPVTPVKKGIEPPSAAQLMELSAAVAKLGLEVRVIPQLHRILNVL